MVLKGSLLAERITALWRQIAALWNFLEKEEYNMGSVFCTFTNQMLTSCKAYVAL